MLLGRLPGGASGDGSGTDPERGYPGGSFPSEGFDSFSENALATHLIQYPEGELSETGGRMLIGINIHLIKEITGEGAALA